MGARQVQEGFFMYQGAMALRHITVIVHSFLKASAIFDAIKIIDIAW